MALMFSGGDVIQEHTLAGRDHQACGEGLTQLPYFILHLLWCSGGQKMLDIYAAAEGDTVSKVGL